MDENSIETAFGTALQNFFMEHVITGSFLTSVIIITAVYVARTLLIRYVRGDSEILNKDQRQWIHRIKNISIAFLAVALIFIWAPQIQTFALSLTAVAVAVVLTTKELLMCLTGGFMRATSHPFKVGDWISVDGVSGEVIEINTLSLTLEEIDSKTRHFSGRTLHIPNSKFLTATVENANFQKQYVYHPISITIVHTDIDPAALQSAFEAIVEAHYEPHIKAAERFNKMVERKTGIDFADAKAEYGIKTTDQGHYTFTVRLFIPTKDFSQLEADITKEFLDEAYRIRLLAKSSRQEQKIDE